MAAFVRPSMLTLAEKCKLAPVLNARFPTTNANIQRGQLVDAEVSAALTGGAAPTDPDAVACVQWLRANVQVTHVQQRVELLDDEGGLVSAGTPDLVGCDSWNPNTLLIIDLKKAEQCLVGNIPPVDESLQLHAYALAHVRRGFTKYRMAYLLFGEGSAVPEWSREYGPEEWAPVFDRIRSICAQTGQASEGDATLPPVVGTDGPHCLTCYARAKCPHWLIPAPIDEEENSALVPFTREGGLNPQTIERAYLTYKATKEWAERAGELLKAYRMREGPGSVTVGGKEWQPTIQKGRESADLARLRQDGLTGYIKRGSDYEVWRLTAKRAK